MPRLILIVSDLYPTAQSVAARSAMPRLAQLERWLTRGETLELKRDWRQWLAREVLGATAEDLSMAQIAARTVARVRGAALRVAGPALREPGAAPRDPGDAHPWLATPVHLVAGLDTVRLHPQGLLRLGLEEQRELAGDFAEVFKDSGWGLQATGQRELLVNAAGEQRATSGDPARWLGADPSTGMVQGAAAGSLRRFTTELEMWLHEHAVNRKRVAQGQLAVSGLWLWGGAAAGGSLEQASASASGPASRAPGRALRAPGRGVAAVYGADLYLGGLARLTGVEAQALPAQWSAMPQTDRAGTVPGGDTLVLHELGASPLEPLLRLERDWIAPLMAGWEERRAGVRRWESVCLVTGTRVVTLRPSRRWWRNLRRVRPWWESLLTC